jgi:4-carboxymuconolactone decarboxylase
VRALDPATRGLVAVAAAIDNSSESALVTRMERCKAEGTKAEWLEELVLSAVLFAGFPKALVAAAALRGAQPLRADMTDAGDYGSWEQWRARGEDTCRVIYGTGYDKLRRNVQALNPALDAWIVTDGYGRTISRPGLDLRRRELCAIAMLVPQNVPRQLHSHLRGALNAGASEADVDETLDITAGASAMPPDRVQAARILWSQIRELPSR